MYFPNKKVRFTTKFKVYYDNIIWEIIVVLPYNTYTWFIAFFNNLHTCSDNEKVVKGYFIFINKLCILRD